MTMNPTWNAQPGMAAALPSPSLMRAELRKIMTTSMWWAMLIPTAGVALLWSWGGTALITAVFKQVNSNAALSTIGAKVPDLPFASFALARSINFAVVFPMLLGGLAIATELHRKTITTTYLTAPSRMAVLSSKLGVYGAAGLVYGLLVGGFASLGTYLGALTADHTAYLPDASVWLGMVGAGVLASVLWTLLGVGVGALLGNVVATVIVLVMYTIMVENLLGLLLPQLGAHVPAFLPNQSGSGIVSSIGADDFVARIPDVPFDLRGGLVQGARYVAGAGGTYAWWIEAIIFLVWTAIFCGLGLLVSKQRDIT